jgi:hypothetical protein
VPRECRGGVLDGGDTGESAVGNGRVLLVQLPFGVVGTWGLVRLVRLASNDKTPCWVLKEQLVAPVVWVVVFSGSA